MTEQAIISMKQTKTKNILNISAKRNEVTKKNQTIELENKITEIKNSQVGSKVSKF